MTLFIVGFPLGPFFSYLNNIFEIRIDAFKTLTQLRRPVAKKAKDIGIWLPIIYVVSKLGILTNVKQLINLFRK
jgi:anoctamin-1